jgi:hypothetical protein
MNLGVRRLTVSEVADDCYEYEEDVICVHATDKAIKVTPIHPHKPLPFWVPQSQIHEDSEVFQKGDEGKLRVKMWYAKEVGWED